MLSLANILSNAGKIQADEDDKQNKIVEDVLSKANCAEFNKCYQCLTTLKDQILAATTPDASAQLSAFAFFDIFLNALKRLPVELSKVPLPQLSVCIQENFFSIFVLMSSLFYNRCGDSLMLCTQKRHMDSWLLKSANLKEFSATIVKDLEIINRDSKLSSEDTINLLQLVECCCRHVFLTLQDTFQDLLGEATLSLVSMLLFWKLDLCTKSDTKVVNPDYVFNYIVLQATYGQPVEEFLEAHSRIMLLITNLHAVETDIKKRGSAFMSGGHSEQNIYPVNGASKTATSS